MNRKLRMGMVGGGKDAFIGAVHRMAAALDGKIELVCGCFSSTPEKSKASGKDFFLPDNRVYNTYQEMMTAEAALPADERMDIVSIVTPNSTHFPVAIAALEAGFDVICDKPMTLTLADAKELEATVEKTGLVFCLTHNYTGYPMVKEARERIARGDIGTVRKIVVEYPQGWLADKLEETGQKQAGWRTDPSQAGASCCMGDIGTHAENLAEFMTGLQITELCADLTTFVEGRPLEDDGNVLLRFDNGARGILHASQISVGEENSLHIRVYGTTGGIEWDQMEPNTLTIKKSDSSREILRTSGGNLGEAAGYNTRLPAGHPEGYVEAFANLYRNFAEVVSAKKEGREPDALATDFPTATDGVRGMAFIQTVVESSKTDDKWTPFAT